MKGLVVRGGQYGCLMGAVLRRIVLLAILGAAAGTGHAAEISEPLVFGGDASFPPFEWLDQGVPRGLNVDLLHELAKLSGSGAEFRLGIGSNTTSALGRGDVDVIAASPTEEHSRELLFTAPFHYVDYAVYGAPGVHDLTELADLNGQRVAMALRSPIGEQLEREGIRIRALLTDDAVRALQALVDDGAEYAVLPMAAADRLIHHMDLPIKKVLPVKGALAYSFAVHRSRPELFAALQDGLEQARRSGQLQAIQQHWAPEMEFVPPPDAERRWLLLLVLLSLLTMAMLGALLWSLRLRQGIRARTEELTISLARVEDAQSRARRYADYDSATNLPREHEFIRQVDDMLSQGDRNKVRELRLIKLTALNEIIKMLGRDYAEQLIRRFADSIRNLSQGYPCGYLGRGVYALYHESQSMPRIFETLISHWNGRDEGVYAQIVGGSAYWPEHGQKGADLVQCAETALSASRAAGKPWLAYSPDMEPRADDLEIVSQFRANELDGLTAVYQPQISLRQGDVVSGEALVRWNHPTLGMMPPARFIPLIEKAGLVAQVTTRMLDRAAQMSATLHAEGLPSTISVNITISDLMEGDLPAKVEQALRRHGAAPSDLKLELTESSVASDLQSAQVVLRDLHDLGVLLSVDDFGTGYSSLSYLSAFPIHEVKIDRHFVFDMTRNPRNRSIVRSTILMAGELGLQTVAEGAEDRATLELLAEYQCDRVQGYVFSPPLEESAFKDFARRYKDGGLL